MPSPSRTSLDAIVSAGVKVLDERGLAGLTMQSVAAAVGVKPPSLYKHVADRDALLGLVADAVALQLTSRLADARDLGALARGLRQWALARPEAYGLLFSGHGTEAVAAAVAAPVLAVGRDLAGAAHKLDAARLVTSWATGFISMELAGAFKLGGSVDQAYEFGIAALSAGLSGEAPAAAPSPAAAPDIVVSAVVLRDSAGRILTVRKQGTSRFMLPGGKREPGESAADAAVRECAEELGLVLTVGGLASVGTFLADAANEPGLVIQGDVFEHALLGEPTAAAEIAELRWLDPSAALPGDLAPLLQHHVLPVLAARAKAARH